MPTRTFSVFMLVQALLLTAFTGFSQNSLAPKVIPPSPEAGNLGKYGDFPVGYYTGVPSISLPLYQIKVRDVAVPISLDYHASGIRVNDEASWVGLGWALSAGGVITRTVMGEDDFKNVSGQSYFNASAPNCPTVALNSPADEASFLAGNTFFGTGCQVSFKAPNVTPSPTVLNLTSFISLSSSPQIDFQPDQYSFNFLGQSGKFMLDRNKQAILVKQEKIRIRYDEPNGQWIVTTIDGQTYYFGKAEEYKGLESSPGTGAPVKTAWYLTKIVSTQGEEVSFVYQTQAGQEMRSEIAIGDVINWTTYNLGDNAASCPTAPYGGPSLEPRKLYTIQTLKEINFKFGKVVFEADENRPDVEWGKKLNAIRIFRKLADGSFEATPWREIAFGYDYFVGSNGRPFAPTLGTKQTNRLKLLNITQRAPGEQDIKTSFAYYEGTENEMPSKVTFARDLWGFYNGKITNNTLPVPTEPGIGPTLIPSYRGVLLYPTPHVVNLPRADRSSTENVSDSQRMTLKRIQYPTGGYSEFQYEPNDFDVVKSDQRDYSRLKGTPELVDKSQFIVTAPTSQNGTVDLTKGYGTGGNGTTVLLNVELTIRFANGYKNFSPKSSADKLFLRFRKSSNDYEFFKADLIYYLGGLGLDQNSTTTQPITYRTVVQLPKEVVKWDVYVEPVVAGLAGVSGKLSWTEEITGVAPGGAGAVALAGGLRVKRIVDNDGKAGNKIRVFQYRIDEDRNGDGQAETYSSGRRMSKPLHVTYEYSIASQTTGNATFKDLCAHFYMNSESYIPLGGTIVGYDQVSVLYGENGENGKSTFKYDNTSDAIVEYEFRRAAGIPNYSSNRNGLLLNQSDYRRETNGNYTLLRSTTNTYQSSNHQVILGIRVNALPKAVGDFATQCEIATQFYPAVNAEWVYLTSSKVDAYENGSLITQLTEYEYSPLNYLQSKVRQQTSVANEMLETRYRYNADYATSAGAFLDALANKHIFNSVIEEKQLRSGKVIGGRINLYNTAGQPVEIYKFESSTPQTDWTPSTTQIVSPSNLFKKKLVLEYDGSANLIRTTPVDGQSTTYLWSYNNALPVAECRNVSASELSATGINLTTLGNSMYTDAALNSLLNPLRQQLPKALITSLSHDTLVGQTSLTDPSGLTTFYEYDKMGRLNVVKNKNGSVVKSYRYKLP